MTVSLMRMSLNNSLAGQEFAKIDIGIFTEAIKEWDLDHDGKISFEEFAQIMSIKLDKLTKVNMNNTIQLTTEAD